MKYLLILGMLLSSTLYAQDKKTDKEPVKTRKVNRQVLVDGIVIDAQEEIVLSKPRVYGAVNKESEVNFSIQKFKIGKEVKGEFKGFKGRAKLNNATLYYLKGEVIANTIDTENEKRDSHLKSGAFFAVNNYPHIKFSIPRAVNFNMSQEFRTKGYLTIKGQRKPVKLKMKVLNGRKGRYIILGETTINRYDFGVSWNKRMDKQERSLFETLKDFAQGVGDKYVLDKDVDISFRLTLLPTG